MISRDDNLRQYATDREWELYLLYCEHGSFGAVAKAVSQDRRGVTRTIKAIFKRAALKGYAPDHGLTHVLPDGLRLKGTSIRYNADGKIEQYWNKSQVEGREREDCAYAPDPKLITKTSTLLDQEGKVTQQWVSEKQDDREKETLWRLFAEELKTPLLKYEPVPFATKTRADMLACYPVGDHHLGMLAWGKETGSTSYDINIGEALLCGAADYLIQTVAPCERALVAFLGDFMHYDSFEAVTPTSRNLLDADGRYPKMVRAAVRAMRYVISAALRRHERVHVIVEIGNHDLSSSVFLMECLAVAYENEPRVTIDTSPAHYHYFEFGKTLIGTHHGHGTSKPDRLPGIMAADRAEAWGRTKHRYWWTGHIHTRTASDFAGCSVESFRVLAPVDAWAAQKGYRAIRDMKAIEIHKEQGEVARHTFNPEMLLAGGV